MLGSAQLDVPAQHVSQLHCWHRDGDMKRPVLIGTCAHSRRAHSKAAATSSFLRFQRMTRAAAKRHKSLANTGPNLYTHNLVSRCPCDRPHSKPL
jgi:hypothetical protein